MGGEVTAEIQVQRNSKGITLIRIKGETWDSARQSIESAAKQQADIRLFLLRSTMTPAGDGWWIARKLS
jgi:hypothetical protein